MEFSGDLAPRKCVSHMKCNNVAFKINLPIFAKAMVGKRRKIAMSFKSLLKAYGAVLFLFLYLIGSSRIESFHELVVPHDPPELHAAEQESDPCHRNIYHQESTNDCEHATHIVDNHKCPLSDSQVHSAQILETSLVAVSVYFSLTTSRPTRSSEAEGFYSYSSGRAPPKAV